MKTTRNPMKIALWTAPFLVLVACGGGGGSDDGDTTNPPPGSGSASAPLSDAAAGIPLVGQLVADCADTGVGLVDVVVDAVDGIAGDSLPASVPSLGESLEDVLDLSTLPILGGLAPTEGGTLVPISLEDLLLMLPGGSTFAGLPVLGQLPAVCSSLLGVLPPDAVTDPTALLEILGDPTAALGFIPVLDGAGNPVAVILATLPSALEGGGLGGLPGLPGGTVIPDLTELAPLDPGSVPVLGGIVSNLLGILNGGGVGGLGGLGSLLMVLGFLLP